MIFVPLERKPKFLCLFTRATRCPPSSRPSLLQCAPLHAPDSFPFFQCSTFVPALGPGDRMFLLPRIFLPYFHRADFSWSFGSYLNCHLFREDFPEYPIQRISFYPESLQKLPLILLTLLILVQRLSLLENYFRYSLV